MRLLVAGEQCSVEVTVWDEAFVNFSGGQIWSFRQEWGKTRATSKQRHCNHTHQPVFTSINVTALHSGTHLSLQPSSVISHSRNNEWCYQFLTILPLKAEIVEAHAPPSPTTRQHGQQSCARGTPWPYPGSAVDNAE